MEEQPRLPEGKVINLSLTAPLPALSEVPMDTRAMLSKSLSIQVEEPKKGKKKTTVLTVAASQAGWG